MRPNQEIEQTAGFAVRSSSPHLDTAVRFFEPESRILASKLADVDGLRFAQVEYISGPSALGNEPRHHAIYFASGFQAGASQVMFSVDAARSAWKAMEPLLTAILASMKFTQPQGNP